MIRFPINNKWTQTNSSDKTTSIAYSKNINLDEAGYLKLSPRSISLFDGTENTTNIGDTDFGFVSAFGRYSNGSFRLTTTDEPFNVSISDISKSIAEDASANNPNETTSSHGVWWQNRFYASTDTAVYYNSAGTWTANAITGLTSGVRHYMCVHKAKNRLMVTNGNVVTMYDTNHSATISATIPSDFEICGIAYNNAKAGFVTRLGSDTAGQNAESYFFTWDASGDNTKVYSFSLGAYAGVSVVPYKSSFAVLTSQGQLLYFNGGGFGELAHFPFYNDERTWGDILNFLAYGDNMFVDGDVIYINVGFDLGNVGEKQEVFLQKNPSGVWCFDPEAGLYHKYSPSISRVYLHTITAGDIDTSTDTFTTSITIPATGNPVLMTEGCTDLEKGTVYYVIKASATTFKLATSKENALAGVSIDITDTTQSYFWIYELKDYGVTYFTRSGAVNSWGESKIMYRDIIFSDNLNDTSLNTDTYLNTSVPFLEGRGYVVLPKLFLDTTTISIPRIQIKHRPLKTNDAIIVKIKQRELVGLPSSSPNSHVTVDEFIWTSDDEGYTSSDLAEAKTAFEAGEEIEIEFTAGAGAGQMVKITDIAYASGVYSLVLEEKVVGAVAGLKSHFVVDNWKYLGEANATNQKDGLLDLAVAGQNSKSPQIKIELRGYETTIEDVQVINK